MAPPPLASGCSCAMLGMDRPPSCPRGVSPALDPETLTCDRSTGWPPGETRRAAAPSPSAAGAAAACCWLRCRRCPAAPAAPPPAAAGASALALLPGSAGGVGCCSCSSPSAEAMERAEQVESSAASEPWGPPASPAMVEGGVLRLCTPPCPVRLQSDKRKIFSKPAASAVGRGGRCQHEARLHPYCMLTRRWRAWARASPRRRCRCAPAAAAAC